MNKLVLLIEDDTEQILIYKNVFDAENISFVGAINGEIGLVLAKEKQPSVIIIDTIMDGEDGQTILKNLKADKLTQNIPVIVFSNFSKKSVKKKYLALGASQLWYKGELVPTDLAKEVKEYLGMG
jgi:CheY-like chemotaxis protein